jgi:hypothetical protein
VGGGFTRAPLTWIAKRRARQRKALRVAMQVAPACGLNPGRSDFRKERYPSAFAMQVPVRHRGGTTVAEQTAESTKWLR